VTARLTFVAIDEARKPTPVPALLTDSDSTKISQAAGEARRAARLTRPVIAEKR
jgi:acyl-CoA hydrolase